MTPKDIANQLVQAFMNADSNKLSDYSHIEWPTAKKCAEITANEIIKEIDENYDTLHSADRKQYWEQVKQELENL